MAKAETTTTKTPEVEKAAKLPKMLFVLDTTATPESGVRKHEQIIDGLRRAFEFEPSKPLELPYATAIKFLKNEGFVQTDAKGNILDFARRPKQPHELGAGEKIELGEAETIARYDELSPRALFARCLELPGGEKFASSETRPADKDMIAFLLKHRAETAKANRSKEMDVGRDEFTPQAEADDDFDAGDED